MTLERAIFLKWLLAARTRPFQWGAADCCLMAADSQVWFGRRDHADDFRGTYHTRTGAARALLQRGYRGVEDAFSDRMGRLPGHSVKFGDIVVADWGQRPAAGVYDGANGVWLQGLNGLVRAPWIGGPVFRGCPLAGGA